MVTIEEFQEAVETIKRYKKQLMAEQARVRKILAENNVLQAPALTPQTNLAESGLSRRAKNVLREIGFEIIKQDKVDASKFCLGDFEGINVSHLRKVRNVGVKTVEDIRLAFLEAGVSMK